MSGWKRAQASRGGIVLAAAAVALVALLGGAVASASTTAVPKAMVGCWQHHVPLLTVGTPAGLWLMKITTGGKLAAYTPGTASCGGIPDFTANITVAGSRLTIGPIKICGTRGVYTWKATASTLTLHATADKGCPPRAALFTAVWKKK